MRAEGQAAPDFTLPDQNGDEVTLSELRGQAVVLYFYPRDDTPGCTLEGEQFRDLHGAFVAAGVPVFGMSRDSLASHEKFKKKMTFPFELLSDADETVASIFGVMKMKNMYGRQVRGVERSTFVIDGSGKLRKEWRGVKVPNHVDQVLAFAQSLA